MIFPKSYLLRLNLANAFRSPNIAELTQNGIHAQRYEQGNADLKSQRNYEADISWHYHSKKFLLDFAGYYNHIENYIYLSPSQDSTASGQQIFKYQQQTAAIYGLEAGISFLPMKFIKLNTNYTHTIGKQENGEFLPFIPQNKLRSSITFLQDKIKFLKRPYFKLELLYAFDQNNPALFETRSPDYFTFDINIGADIKLNKQLMTIFISGTNILNEVYIDHLSTLKSLKFNNPGRSINLGISIPIGLKN